MLNSTLWKEFVNANRQVTTTIADISDGQIKLLQEGYVNRLVGQMPFQIGTDSVDQLLRINQGKNVEQDVLLSPLLDVAKVPTVLPSIIVDNNYIGNLAIIGYIFCAVVALFSISITEWVWFNRKNSVIRASQPLFLYMICAGTLVMGLSIIPLAFDDETSHHNADIACMASPCMFFLGASAVYAALIYKTIRINKIMKNANHFRRVKVIPKDVMTTYIIIMVVNVIFLLCWTLITPSKFIRQPLPGTDEWDRFLH